MQNLNQKLISTYLVHYSMPKLYQPGEVAIKANPRKSTAIINTVNVAKPDLPINFQTTPVSVSPSFVTQSNLVQTKGNEVIAAIAKTCLVIGAGCILVLFIKARVDWYREVQEQKRQNDSLAERN